MGETEIELSRYFGVDVVPKGPGTNGLIEALKKYFPASGQQSAGS